MAAPGRRTSALPSRTTCSPSCTTRATPSSTNTAPSRTTRAVPSSTNTAPSRTTRAVPDVGGRTPQPRSGRGVWRVAAAPSELRDDGRQRVGDRHMLPDPDDPPPGRGQRRVRRPVPLHVLAQLRRPVPLVDRGITAVLRAGVPEAAVHKDGHPAGGERYVRADLDTFVEHQAEIFAEPVSLAVQRAPQRDLGLGVGAPDGAHVGRPARAGGGWVVIHGAQG